MKQVYGVWAGEYDNDAANWYEDHGTAFEAWHKLADTLADGKITYIQRFDEDGTPNEDYAYELRREGEDIREYRNGERCWA